MNRHEEFDHQLQWAVHFATYVPGVKGKMPSRMVTLLRKAFGLTRSDFGYVLGTSLLVVDCIEDGSWPQTDQVESRLVGLINQLPCSAAHAGTI